MQSEREEKIKKAMTRGWRWSLGRSNLPWRLDGKPPTAMWVRTRRGGDEDDIDDLVMMMMKMTCVAWFKVK